MKPNAAHAMVGGFVGTIIMTIAMSTISPDIIGMNMDIANLLGSLLGVQYPVTEVVHFVNGTIVFPLIYVYVLYHWLPGAPAIKGIAWGTILWFLLQTVVGPIMGTGFFSSSMGGIRAAVSSLLLHIAYGGCVGIGSAPALERLDVYVSRLVHGREVRD